jgi:hypothetical protein
MVHGACRDTDPRSTTRSSESSRCRSTLQATDFDRALLVLSRLVSHFSLSSRHQSSRGPIVDSGNRYSLLAFAELAHAITTAPDRRSSTSNVYTRR